MKLASIYIGDEDVTITLGSCSSLGHHCVINNSSSFVFDHRTKAPKAHLAKRVARYLNSVGDNSYTLVCNLSFSPSLLWTKVTDRIEAKCVFSEFVAMEGEDSKDLIRQYARRLKKSARLSQ